MRVLFAGASGFGNCGDDCYRLAFRRGLGAQHELRFDSPYPDLEAVRWCDALVIGGGGLLYCNATEHFDYMEQYMLEADRLAKPIAFSSVGIQLTGSAEELATEAHCLNQAGQVAPWAPWLERAIAVSVRSPLDVRLINAICRRLPAPACWPDLGYAVRASPGAPQLIGADATVVCPTQALVGEHLAEIRRLHWEARAEGRPFYVVPIAREDEASAAELRERLELLQGREVLSPVDVHDWVDGILPYAAVVLSGRYHGYVLARAQGVPQISRIDRRIKSRFEPDWPHPELDAPQHVALLERALSRL